jgi:hypothetical protein
MSDGFLSRWSQRKQALREGKPVQDPLPEGTHANGIVQETARGMEAGEVPRDESTKPLPTLQDAQALTQNSDYSTYMLQGVSPEVKNAAMKKLFTNPHFNVMDGLDIYIDDYSKPDPLPLSMMRQMTSAKFLNLFDEEDKKGASAINLPPRDDPGGDQTQNMAESNSLPPTLSNQDAHANTDLRLQQDHASAEPGAGRDAQ